MLIDAPAYAKRKMINVKRLELTDLTIEITRLFNKQKLKEALEKDGMQLTTIARVTTAMKHVSLMFKSIKLK